SSTALTLARVAREQSQLRRDSTPTYSEGRTACRKASQLLDDANTLWNESVAATFRRAEEYEDIDVELDQACESCAQAQEMLEEGESALHRGRCLLELVWLRDRPLHDLRRAMYTAESLAAAALTAVTAAKEAVSLSRFAPVQGE